MSDRLITYILAGALAYFAYATYQGANCPDGKCPVAPQPSPLRQPTPSPLPRPKKPCPCKVEVLWRADCQWCVKLKSEWPAGGWPVPVEWVDVATPTGREKAVNYRIEGTPCLIAIDDEGREVRRMLGYKSQAELLAWLGIDTP